MPLSRAPTKASALDHLVDALELPLGLALLDELAHAVDDLAGAGCLRHRLVHGVVEALDGRRVLAGEEAPAGLDVVDDRGQRLVELMRQRRRHLPHGREA
jgi:hypothetical protein